MKTIKHKGKEIKFYSSIKEMPIDRYWAMQGFLIQDSGIGSTMSDIENHFRNLDMFLSSGKIQDAIVERQNLHMNFYTAINNISFRCLSFACLIQSISGKPIGLSESDLKNALDKITDIPFGEVEDILFDLKKNCIGN